MIISCGFNVSLKLLTDMMTWNDDTLKTAVAGDEDRSFILRQLRQLWAANEA